MVSPDELLVTRLGACRVRSPLNLSNVAGDYVPDYTDDQGRVLLDVEFADGEQVASLGFSVRERKSSDPRNPGLFVEIDQVVSASAAFKAGLRPGMRILGVGQTETRNLSQFDQAVRGLDPSKGLVVVVQSRDGRVAAIRVGGDSPRP